MFPTSSRRFALSTSALTAAIALASTLSQTALAQPTIITAPNVTTTAGATSVTFGGQTFVDHGLQGVARLPAAPRDFNGDSLGAFSALDIVPGSWRKTTNGYTGTLWALPDRGPNGVGDVNFSNYPARVNTFSMAFNPYTGTANLPVSIESNKQLVLTQTGGFLFRDFSGNVTTGLDPGTGATAFVTQNGKRLPGSTTGAAANKIALDAEGIRILNNGLFYVSDEYGANVYFFDSAGRMQGVIEPPAAVAPRTADGSPSFSSVTNAVTGRRVNQGLEGLALTPDSKKLVTLLQSAAMQDSATAQNTRTNTRLMIYDIAGNATPTAPIGHYVLQLPIFNATGTGTPNRTAAQSELLALNDNQFLVLARDGNGLGQTTTNPVYKSVLLVDITGATNLAGTTYETTTTPIAPSGVLNSAIKPVSQMPLVNMLNSTQLTKFGMNLVNTTPTQFTLTEKIEGMALVPVLEENAPQDFFLMVGNDNDFLSSTCSVGGENCAQSVNSDPLVMVYRLTLPTYVDSQYLLAAEEAAPVTIGVNALTTRDVAGLHSDSIGQHLAVQRHAETYSAVWLDVGLPDRDEDGTSPELNGTRFTLGADVAIDDQWLVGVAGGYFSGDAALGGFGADAESYQLSAFGAYRNAGLFANVAGSFGNVDFDAITRPSAYGLTADGSTDGTTSLIAAELGYLFDSGSLNIGPVVGAQWNKLVLDGYLEHGASGGNLRYSELDDSKTSMFAGGEASAAFADTRGIVRVTWHEETADDTLGTSVALNSANHAMGTRALDVASLAQSHVKVALTLTELKTGPLNWWANYSTIIGEDDGRLDQLSAGFRWAF
jgi:uncharacterized protein YhjY with autotransporter beta-barrel domain